jgi:uncharacterized phage-associated protein
LTGDRPEAWDFGPVYRRLADVLEACGLDPVKKIMTKVSNLDPSELTMIARVYRDYGQFSGAQLSNLTRRGTALWHQVYADGAGKLRDIPHELMRAQFVALIEERRT